MTGCTTISRAKLGDDVHQALRLWHARHEELSPLSHLCLYQQALRANGHHIRLATNAVLDQALKGLEVDYDPLEVALLRQHFLERATMYQVANQLNIAESWANKRQREAIEHLADVLYRMESCARTDYLIELETRLDLPPETPLIGVDAHLSSLFNLLNSPDPPWLISIEGLGGIGKTSLARALLCEIAPTNRFYNVAWVSAKQQDFWPGSGLKKPSRPALDPDSLIDSLLEQLGDEAARTVPPPQKKTILTQLLKSQPYLVVIDNLETVVDYQSLLPWLLRLVNPSKFLLTSRYMQNHSGISRLTLLELSREHTFNLLHYEANVRRLTALAEATTAQLEMIYQVVGGNPLALKLIVGQINALPLPQILDNLKKARDRKTDELYNFIYWQAWDMLDAAGRQALLTMPLAQNGVLAQLAATSRLEPDELSGALEQLVSLSLIEVNGGLEHRRYRIHRLTETFLLTQVFKWPSSR